MQEIWQDIPTVSQISFNKVDLFFIILGNRRDAAVAECENGKVGITKNLFSECLDGVQLPIQKCPDGLQFSDKAQTCVPGYLL